MTVSPTLPSVPEPTVVFTTLETTGAFATTATVALLVVLLKPTASVGVKLIVYEPPLTGVAAGAAHAYVPATVTPLIDAEQPEIVELLKA